MSYYYNLPMQNSSSSSSSTISRPSSVSPQFTPLMHSHIGLSNQMNPRSRFDLPHGFEEEDDLEFCPALTSRFNSSTFTPLSSPMQNHSNMSIHSSPDVSSPVQSSSSHHHQHLTGLSKTRKIIEIVDPTTGRCISGSPRR